jgi:translocation and assembly module TamA
MTRSTPGGALAGWRCAGALALLLACLTCGPAQAADAGRIRIEVDGVEREIADNVRAFLTLTRYLDREEVTDSQVRRLADRAVDEAADALRPFGYYEPVIRSRTSRDGATWIVRLRIKPGEPVMMESVDVRITGPGADEAALREVVAASALQPGSRLNHPTYDRLRNDLLRVARDIGFLDAELTRRELIVNPPARAAAAYLEIDTGGRYRFGAVAIEQDVIDDELLKRFVRFETGQVFSTARLRNTQFALQDSNYFSTVTVTPGERDPETLTVPVTIRGDAIKRHRYAVSLGYGTDTEIRGRFSWDNRRVNQHGHRLRFETTASGVLTEIVTRYVIPIGDPALEKLEFSAAYIDEELGDLDSRRTELTGGLTHAMGQWQRVLFLMLNQERTSFADGSSRDDLLLIPGISYASMPPNFLTGWVRDSAYYFELSGSPETLGSDASYLRFYTRAERVWPVSGPWYLRLRGEFGTSWVNDFSELPASQRFFAGGDRSVRGFALDSLSPVVETVSDTGQVTRQSVGGEHKIVGSIEIERDLPRNLRGAMFVDAGNAFSDWSTPLEYSVGLGVRWRLPMLLIGVDVAQALSESGMRPRLHLNITQVL